MARHQKCSSFSCFLLPSADFFQNLFFQKNSFTNTVGVSNSLDPDEDRS